MKLYCDVIYNSTTGNSLKDGTLKRFVVKVICSTLLYSLDLG